MPTKRVKTAAEKDRLRTQRYRDEHSADPEYRADHLCSPLFTCLLFNVTFCTEAKVAAAARVNIGAADVRQFGGLEGQ